jgi:UDP-glucose 4-epimerase
MRVLIAGGAGFIGSHLVESWQGKAEVRVLDNLRSGFAQNLKEFQSDFIHGSVLERETVRRAMQGVDCVFHLAAMISVPESMQKPTQCVETNTLGTLVVLEEAARAKVKKLVFSSSAAIYGRNPATPKSETMLPEPGSPYAITKLGGEYYCKMFAEEGWLQTTCLRYFNVFGPRQDPASHYAAAVPIFIERMLKHEPVTIFGDGGQTRDFVYVTDVSAANRFFALTPSLGGVFNVARGRQLTILELARTLRQLTNSRSEINFAAGRAGDVKHSLASVEKTRAAGFSPQTSLLDGLRATVDYFASRI